MPLANVDVAMGLLVVAMEPTAGTVGGIRWALVAVAVGGALLGSAALLGLSLAPPVEKRTLAGHDRSRPLGPVTGADGQS